MLKPFLRSLFQENMQTFLTVAKKKCLLKMGITLRYSRMVGFNIITMDVYNKINTLHIICTVKWYSKYQLS